MTTTVFAKLRLLTKERTKSLSVVHKTIVYVFEREVDARADGRAGTTSSSSSSSRSRSHSAFLDHLYTDLTCAVNCFGDHGDDGDDWRRIGCSFPAEGSFGEVARPLMVESRLAIDVFAQIPDGERILIDWHYPGGWNPVWEYARSVDSARWSLDRKSHKDVVKCTVYHRYTSADTTLLGKDVGELHDLANIEIYPSAKERGRAVTDARDRAGSAAGKARAKAAVEAMQSRCRTAGA